MRRSPYGIFITPRVAWLSVEVSSSSSSGSSFSSLSSLSSLSSCSSSFSSSCSSSFSSCSSSFSSSSCSSSFSSCSSSSCSSSFSSSSCSSSFSSCSSSFSSSCSSSFSSSSCSSSFSSCSSSFSSSCSSSFSSSSSCSSSFSSSCSSSSCSSRTNNYTRGEYLNLPIDDSDLHIPFTNSEYDDVAEDDNVYVVQCARHVLDPFAVFLWKDKHDSDEDVIIAQCKLKTSIAPSVSTVYLQIYNHGINSWETLDSDAVTGADIEFTLFGEQSTSLPDYYDIDGFVVCRVYQEAQ